MAKRTMVIDCTVDSSFTGTHNNNVVLPFMDVITNETVLLSLKRGGPVHWELTNNSHDFVIITAEPFVKMELVPGQCLLPMDAFRNVRMPGKKVRSEIKENHPEFFI